jgi:cytosine/adenosine deaminase-related metal-dependent hydrolase
MAISVKARVVFPVDRPPIQHGVVTIEGNRIVEVGTTAPTGDVIHLGLTALMPGLVNSHTHLEFSDLQKPLGMPGMSLVEWIRLVIAQRRRNDDSQGPSLLRGLLESRTAGVTTIGDIATSTDDLSGGTIDATYFHEVIGFSLPRAESALSAVCGKSALNPRWLAFRAGHSGCDTRHGISPHAPYTVSPQLIYELVMLARERSMPMAMHLAESREELELLQSGEGPFQELLEERSMWDPDVIPLGSRPMNYLKLIADAPRSLVIHGNYLDKEELAFIGARREKMSLVFCPRTHAYFKHDAYPLAKAAAAGARVALGTDSRASNPDLDLLAEMRVVARAHSEISPHDVLRMGTLAGAEALGRDGDAGSLTAGKLANLVAVPLPADFNGGPDAALESLLASDARVSAVWVRGTRCKLGAA